MLFSASLASSRAAAADPPAEDSAPVPAPPASPPQAPPPSPTPSRDATDATSGNQAEASPPDAPGEDEPPAPPPITPPQVLEKKLAEYPPALLARPKGHVELFVTIDQGGAITDVEVAVSAGAEFDAAATAAVRTWRFAPARRGDEPVASRVRIVFDFEPPAPPAPPAPQPPVPVAPPKREPPPAVHTQDAVELTVHGRREPRTEARSISDFRIQRDVIEAAPRAEGADVLWTVPGLFIGKGEGPSVAPNYYLRGFDSEHGQDIEFLVGGLPINLPSHIHGQGYADLNFLISDVVSEVQAKEGVSDPRQGDFAVAGTIDVGLGVDEERRGVTARSSYGAFDTFRQLVSWAPSSQPEETFGAVQYQQTSGFGENRAGRSGSAILQHRFGEGPMTYRYVGFASTSRSDLAGVLRQDDVQSGNVCFECVYPLPTAEAQNAFGNRLMSGLFADYFGEGGDNGQLGFWLGLDDFRLQRNFTGFVETSRTLAGVSGRGDLIEQRNRTLSAGLKGRYRTSYFRPSSWAAGTVEVGASGRFDVVDQQQNLLDATRNETWDRRVDANVQALDMGVWGDLDWVFSDYVHVRAGLRADVLSYDVDDELGNFIELSRDPDSFIVGFRRTASGVAWGPRTSVEVHPLESFSVLASYGEGYRSPQARLLEDGEPAPFTKVRSADLGVHHDWHDVLHTSVGGFYTHLSDDVAFDAAEGRLERVGASQRLGAVAHVYATPTEWLVGSASVTFVDATLLEPPPPTTEDPQPPFVEGQSLPFVPPVAVRADVGVRRVMLDDVAGKPLGARAGVGYSFLSSRPLPYGDFADPVSLLDLNAGGWWGPLDLTFDVFNALDARYSVVEYSFASDWTPNDGFRSRVPERHTSAGSPFAWRVSLGVTL